MRLACKTILRAAVVVATGVTSGCSQAPPKMHAQSAIVRVEDEGKQPIAGAKVLVGGVEYGHTNARGRAGVVVKGTPGDRFPVTLACPAGRKAATPSTHELSVVPTADAGATRPQLVFTCASVTRRAMVAVRAENGPGLPVMHLGREVGRTDESGAATVFVDADADAGFELVLDTASAPHLHPQSPALSFRPTASNAVFVFDQKFTVDKPKIAKRRGPRVPVRL